MPAVHNFAKALKPVSQVATKTNPAPFTNIFSPQTTPSKISPLIKPYYEEVYTSLPSFEGANSVLNAKNGQSCIKFLLRPIFLRYGLHDRLGTDLVHRKFDLKPSERLVNFNGVATPWTHLSHGHFLGRKMTPVAWCIDANGDYVPYEFAFGLSKTEASLDLGSFERFLEEFRDALKTVGLERTIGLRARLEDGVQAQGNVNVASPLLEAKDQSESKIQTTWFFK